METNSRQDISYFEYLDTSDNFCKLLYRKCVRSAVKSVIMKGLAVNVYQVDARVSTVKMRQEGTMSCDIKERSRIRERSTF